MRKLSLKSAIKRLARSLGFEIRRLVPPIPELSPEEKPLSIDILDLAIRDLMKRVEKITFVGIGAHDGTHFDPLRPYIVKYNWHGVLVEPQPRIFTHLTRNYASHPNVQLQNCAISTVDGMGELFAFAENQGLPDHATMLASFSREAILRNAEGYTGEIIAIKVPTFKPSTLLEKCGLSCVNILQIDTEGHDFKILMEFLNGQVLPDLIHFESAFCSPLQRNQFLRKFALHDYRVVDLGIDTIAYKQVSTKDYIERATIKYDTKPLFVLGQETAD